MTHAHPRTTAQRARAWAAAAAIQSRRRHLDARHAERSIIPPDPARAFIAHLIEDFADEWVTKAMFGYRWLQEVDQIQMSRWLAYAALKGGGFKESPCYSEHFRACHGGRVAIFGGPS